MRLDKPTQHIITLGAGVGLRQEYSFYLEPKRYYQIFQYDENTVTNYVIGINTGELNATRLNKAGTISVNHMENHGNPNELDVYPIVHIYNRDGIYKTCSIFVSALTLTLSIISSNIDNIIHLSRG